MKHFYKYLFSLIIILGLQQCRRKTSIKIKVVIGALGYQPVEGAKVVLIERKENGLFSTNAQCKTIAEAITDANGECSFDKEKLSTSNSKDFFALATEAYGQQIGSVCAGKTSGLIKIGESQEQTLNVTTLNGTFIVQYNNLLNPSQLGDSLIISLTTIAYLNPKDGTMVQGGGVGAFPYYDANNPPNNPVTIKLAPKQIQAQQLLRYIRKRKLGVMTIKVDTVKVLPNQTTTVVVDW